MKRLLLVTVQFFFPLGRGRRLDVLGYLLVFLLLFFPLGGWKLITSEISAMDDERVYGEVYDVPGFRWAMVRNRYGVRTAEIQLRRFENCLMRYRGQVTEVTNQSTWWSSWKDQVLVEYTPPEGVESTGVLCPEGTIFYIHRDELDDFPERFQQRQQFEEQLLQEVSAVLDEKRWGQEFQVEDFFTWVEVVNPAGVRNFGYRISFLDVCGIESLGTAQEIGQTSRGALFEYTPDEGRGFVGVGIPCPANTLFFLEGSESVGGLAPQPPRA